MFPLHNTSLLTDEHSSISNKTNLTWLSALKSPSSSHNWTTEIPTPSKHLGNLSAIGHPSTLILNSLVVVILFRKQHQQQPKQRQQQQQQPKQQKRPKTAFVHLLCLTISDLALGIVFLCGALWFYALTGGVMIVDDAALTAITLPPSFKATYLAFFYFLCAVIGNVRWFTLYITIVRAKAVAGIKGSVS